MSGGVSADDLRRLEELFDRAADLPAAEQAEFVERECGGNAALRDELLRLLAGHSGEDLLQGLRPGAAPGPGTRIGPYKLLEKVGEGGMGAVYAAEQVEPIVRRVALKLIKPGMDSAQVVARFEAERQALARMTHPHVAQVFDGGTTPDGYPYFAMEFVAGEPVHEYCDRRKLTTRERLELFLKICHGVQHAHQKGLIHRDLKPSNLLVTQQDGVGTPKIIDFGVARATTGRLADRTLHTMVGQVLGTLDYMSPEQADPTGTDVDTRSDVYSLGVVLYQLLSGLLPFEHLGKDVPLSELQRAIREQDPPTPSTSLRTKAAQIAPLHGADQRSLVRQLAGDLDWICMKALEKDPARRYQSVAELAADVRRHLAHEPVLVRRPGLLYRVRKFTRRHRIAVAAGLLVATAFAIGVFGIVSGRLEVEARNAEVLRLSDGYRLAQIEADAKALWPPHPDRIEDLEALLGRVEGLVKKLSVHRAALSGRAWNLASVEERWEHDLLAELVAGLERVKSQLLDDGPPTETHAWSLPRRLREARALAAGFAEGGPIDAAWDEALPLIRRAYGLPDLTPQMGLMPLGPDPDSELWEFAHLLSGEPAQRDPVTQRLRRTEATGLVLVLLHGGTFSMGAQRTNQDEPNYDPHLDPWDAEREEVHSVTLDPFFISKYEMTQYQWKRVRSANTGPGFPTTTQDVPVTMVTAKDCDLVTGLMGLTLPSEEQWEYAARAGTTTSWWTGNDVKQLQDKANLYDQTLEKEWPAFRRMASGSPVEWADGVDSVAPVGAFPANAFGLHDIHGNVGEWCSTPPYLYSMGLEHLPGEMKGLRMSRGGSFMAGSYAARSAYRGLNNDADFSFPALGLRPARSVSRPRSAR